MIRSKIDICLPANVGDEGHGRQGDVWGGGLSVRWESGWALDILLKIVIQYTFDLQTFVSTQLLDSFEPVFCASCPITIAGRLATILLFLTYFVVVYIGKTVFKKRDDKNFWRVLVSLKVARLPRKFLNN